MCVEIHLREFAVKPHKRCLHYPLSKAIAKGAFILSVKHFTKVKGEHRNNIVKVRFTDDELQHVKELSSFLNLSLAEYIRQMVFTGQIKTHIHQSCDSDQLKQYCYELNKIGINLNQITKRLNSGQPLEKEVLNCIHSLQQTILQQSVQLHNLFGGAD